MNNLKSTIIEKMKTVRASKQLSLEQASEVTGISKAMLSQIERGQSIPTITTLWKISTGYKLPLTYFLSEDKTNYTKVDILDTEPVYEEQEAMRTFTLFPYTPTQHFEILYIEFEPGCVHQSSKHISGVEEYIFIQNGQLELRVHDETILLAEKQCFRFKADVPHCYTNPSDQTCCMINFILYPTIAGVI